MPVPKEILDMLSCLVCPVCKTPVHVTSDETGLKCDSCKRIYPIRDEIPSMLPEEASFAPE